MAKCVWALEQEDITELLCNIQELNSRAWLSVMMKSLKQDEVTRVVVTLWAISHARRKAIHESMFQSPLSTHTFVNRYIEDLDAIKQRAPERQVGLARAGSWIPPPEGFMKINVGGRVRGGGRGVGTAGVFAKKSGRRV